MSRTDARPRPLGLSRRLRLGLAGVVALGCAAVPVHAQTATVGPASAAQPTSPTRPARPADPSGGCESLRAQVEARIKANGVTDAVVRVADAAASVAGSVVGNCDAGRSLLRYTRGGPAGKPTAVAHDGIPTECKDGRIVMGPDCSLPKR